MSAGRFVENAPDGAVRVVTDDGYTRFNRLIDTGAETMYFDTGAGWVAKSDIPAGSIRSGWLTRDAFDAEKRERWPELAHMV